MTLAIFVARDSAEFSKYQKWFEKYAKNEHLSVLYEYKSISLEGNVGYGRSLDPNAPPINSTKQCRGRQKRMAEDLLVLMIEKTEAFPFPRGGGCPDDEGMGRAIVAQLVEVAKVALKQENVKEGTSVEMRIFIHWGAVDPFEQERKFAGFLNNFNGCEQYKMSEPMAFAVSSRRRGCLDVTGEMVTLPDTKEKLEDLVGRFTFDEVKDCMLQYVLANERRRQRQAKEGFFTFGSADDVPVLQRYLIYMRKNWERWSGASKLIKVLMKLMAEKEWGRQLELNDQVAALFSYLLREEVRHG